MFDHVYLALLARMVERRYNTNMGLLASPRMDGQGRTAGLCSSPLSNFPLHYSLLSTQRRRMKTKPPPLFYARRTTFSFGNGGKKYLISKPHLAHTSTHPYRQSLELRVFPLAVTLLRSGEDAFGRTVPIFGWSRSIPLISPSPGSFVFGMLAMHGIGFVFPFYYFTSISQRLLPRTVVPTTIQHDRIHAVQCDIWPFRITVGVLAALTGAIWLKAILTAPLPLSTIFVPSELGLDTFVRAVRKLFQYDQIFFAASSML